MAGDERKDRTSPRGDVISNLPRHRPHRRSDKRTPARAAKAGPSTPAVTEAAPSAPKAAPSPKARPSAAKSAPSSPKARPSTSKAAPSTPRARPSAANARSSAGAGPEPASRSARERIGATAGAKTRPAESGRPASERPPADSPPPRPERPGGPPSGTEVVGTVVQAAGELAQIGLSLGAQAVKNALKRLPKP